MSNLLYFFLFLVACTDIDIFQRIGERFANPIDIAVSADGSHFYVANADFDRTYNKGSLLILHENGDKIKALPMPRMARSVEVAGSYLLLTFSQSTDTDSSSVRLYSLANPADPVLKKEWQIDCQPLNSTQHADYRYFFITCANGHLWQGDRTALTMHLARIYLQPRRAMYLDPQRELLFSFVVDLDEQTRRDQRFVDKFTYDDDKTEKPNGIPDIWERGEIADIDARLYQYAVYDIPRGVEAKKTAADQQSTPANIHDNELNWLIYNLDTKVEEGESIYRTNFWQAHSDPDDADSFYLTQRGYPNTDSNNVIKAKIVGDVRTQPSSALQFTRVFALTNPLAFPSDLAVSKIDNKKVLLVNSARDFVNWRAKNVYFSILAHVLQAPHWQKEFSGKSVDKAYGQFAINAKGTLMVSSFFGNRVYLFHLKPEASFTLQKTIE